MLQNCRVVRFSISYFILYYSILIFINGLSSVWCFVHTGHISVFLSASTNTLSLTICFPVSRISKNPLGHIVYAWPSVACQLGISDLTKTYQSVQRSMILLTATICEFFEARLYWRSFWGRGRSKGSVVCLYVIPNWRLYNHWLA